MKAVQRIIELAASATGNVSVPERIHLMSAGKWNTPYHGDFEMSPEDLSEMVTHFNEGVGLVDKSKRAPINYGHDQGGKAAGWINNLTVEGDELYGDIEWTPAGRQALEDGEYRYISPEWNPKSVPWQNPQVEDEFIENVFGGAALTNIPLFSKLKPVMASRDGSNGSSDNSIKGNKGEDMDLSKIRVKKLEELTDEEKAFLVENKAELTEEELQAFGLVETSEEAEAETETTEEAEATEEVADDAETTEETAEEGVVEEAEETEEAEAEVEEEEATQVEASAQTTSISASRLAQLEAAEKRAQELEASIARNDAKSIMASAVKAGKVKSDQVEAGVKLLLASSGSARKELEAFISALPVNSLLGDEVGDGGEATTAIELTEQEKMYASDFNLTEEEVAEFKKSKESKGA